MTHYATTKAANLATCFEWANRLKSKQIVVSAHHPGEVATAFGLRGPWWLRLFWRIKSRRFIPPSDAATSLVRFLETQYEPTDKNSHFPYYFNSSLQKPAPFLESAELRQIVWETTENLIVDLNS